MGEVSNKDSVVPFVYPIHTRLRIACKPSSGHELVREGDRKTIVRGYELVHVGDLKTSVRVQDGQMFVSCKSTSLGVLGTWTDQLPICKLGNFLSSLSSSAHQRSF